MNEKPVEFWVRHPEFVFIEGSSLGRVRTLNRLVLRGKGTYTVKGHILKQHRRKDSYVDVAFGLNGKTSHLLVHRIVASCFIPNPENLPEINHKNGDRTDNCVSNLEWCTGEYNIAYREKYGKSAKEFVQKSPVYAVNLNTWKILWFRSQHETSRELGVALGSLNSVIKGKKITAGGYWFTEDTGGGFEIDKDKLREIKAGMLYRGGIYAINLSTMEVSQFKSQTEASRILGIGVGNINNVIKVRCKQAGGFWFTYANDHAVESVRKKFGNSVANKVAELVNEKLN